MNINISTATPGKLHAHHIVPSLELIACLWLKIWATFPPAPQVEFSLSNSYVRRTLCFLSQVEWTARDPESKEGQISLQWLKFRLVFHLKDEGMSVSPVETLEKGVVLCLIWKGGITPLWYLERHTELKASKGDDAWLFLKMDRNPNITDPTRKWALVSCLISRRVHIVLPSLVLIPEVSIVTR